MTQRRLQHVSPAGHGRYHPARLRRVRGWTVADDLGRIVYTEAHPHTGRPRPAFVATHARALALCSLLAETDR